MAETAAAIGNKMGAVSLSAVQLSVAKQRVYAFLHTCKHFIKGFQVITAMDMKGSIL
jgi:hypothetical protein